MAIIERDALPVAGLDQGDLTDAAWDGTGDPASIVALLKYIAVQLAAINVNTTA